MQDCFCKGCTKPCLLKNKKAREMKILDVLTVLFIHLIIILLPMIIVSTVLVIASHYLGR